MEDLKEIRDGINEKRRATQSLSKQIQEGKQRLKPTAPRKSKESPPSLLQNAVMKSHMTMKMTISLSKIWKQKGVVLWMWPLIN